MHNDTSVMLSLSGERCTATVPDTLDLADRAALAIRGMANSIDTELMTMYGQIFFHTPRPHQSHCASAETLVDPKFGESFPLMRLMCGSDAFADLEARFRATLRSRIDDGLYAPGLDQNVPAASDQAYRFDGSSAYGSTVALDDSELLAIYDCFTDEHFGIYVVRATIGKT